MLQSFFKPGIILPLFFYAIVPGKPELQVRSQPKYLGSLFNKLHGILYLQFFEQMPAMSFNSIYTDLAFIGDHFGGESFANK